MKQSKMQVMIALLILSLLTACQKETLIHPEMDITPVTNEKKAGNDQSVIVLSAPSVLNNYYASAFDQIIDYMADFANKVDQGNDEIIILADAETLPYFQGKVPNYVLVEANIEDIWIRDFAPVMPSKQIKFNYLPDFQDAYTSNLIDNSFEDWFYNNGLSYSKKTNLILDGGNVVDNGSNRVIVTDRFLWDNPQFTMNQAKNKLKQLMGLSQVAIIPEVPGDATGHADGMIMWVSDNKVLLHQLPQPQHNQTINELEQAFPGVEIVVVDDYYEDDTWQGFTSACNIFVNSLVTDNYIYMPIFDSPYDNQMLQIVRSHTDKQVVPIAAEGVCFMGGSLRCLSWQVKGANAQLLLEE